MTQLEPLASARERVIASLGRHFAQGHITIEELERRLEQAYRAGVPAELATLTHDLPAVDENDPALIVPDTPEPVRGMGRPRESGLAPGGRRMLSLMSNKKHEGYWEPPRELDVAAIMSDVTLDFTAARMPDVMDIRLTAVMANVKFIVPEGARVLEDVSALLADVGNDAPWDGEPHGGPLLRISGTAFMSEVKIRLAVARRRGAVRSSR